MSYSFSLSGQRDKDTNQYQGDGRTKKFDFPIQNLENDDLKYSYLSPKLSKRYSAWSPKGHLNLPKNPETKQVSPEQRNFLRHTTYLAKGKNFLGLEKEDLSSSQVGRKRHQTAYNNYQKDQFNIKSYRSPTYKNHQKFYDNDIYDKIASKVKSTAMSIEEVKKYQMGLSEPVPASKIQTRQTLSPYRHYVGQKKFDTDFKKKNFVRPEFYTPKPESTNSFNNNEKLKRIFSPEVQPFKINSPTFKKFQQEQVSIKDFILGAKIGGGKFGAVHKAIHIKTSSIYAIKKIPKSILKQNMMIQQFILEVKLQRYLKHDNIIQIYGIFNDNDNIYMVLEYMTNGTLYTLLKKKKKLSEEEAGDKIKQISKAIAYMHENAIVHRDIKPQNIVITGDVCKLCDFGWATICQDRRKTRCGTFDYTAPEMIEGGQYDFSVDLWCLGVLTYELLVGKAPFYHISKKQTISKILNVEQNKINYPAHVSSKARSFIDCLLRRNPEERLSYEQILKHPFLCQTKQDK